MPWELRMIGTDSQLGGFEYVYRPLVQYRPNIWNHSGFGQDQTRLSIDD